MKISFLSKWKFGISILPRHSVLRGRKVGSNSFGEKGVVEEKGANQSRQNRTLRPGRDLLRDTLSIVTSSKKVALQRERFYRKRRGRMSKITRISEDLNRPDSLVFASIYFFFLYPFERILSLFRTKHDLKIEISKFRNFSRESRKNILPPFVCNRIFVDGPSFSETLSLTRHSSATLN